MKIDTLLEAKGRTVETIRPEVSIGDVCMRMRARRIGALVVSRDGSRIDGIISERDIVYELARGGFDVLRKTAGQLMIRDVLTCAPDDDVAWVIGLITWKRIRHVPVIDAGKLVGLVSIGDVLKSRLDDLELETVVLRSAYRCP